MDRHPDSIGKRTTTVRQFRKFARAAIPIASRGSTSYTKNNKKQYLAVPNVYCFDLHLNNKQECRMISVVTLIQTQTQTQTL